MNFASGWEWSYWLNDYITARAAWNPQDLTLTHDDALLSAFRECMETIFFSNCIL
jgi:hypothetical protein